MREAVDRIEALIHEEVGRNIGGLFAASKGGLWHAASALASGTHQSVGILTGFYVPLGTPPRLRPTALSAPRCWPVR